MPFSLSSHVTFESEVCPGVTVILRRLNPTRRCQLDRAQADLRAKQRDLLRRYAPQLIDPGTAAGEPCETCGHAVMAREGDPPDVISRKSAEQQILAGESELIEHELQLASLPIYVDQIDGLILDGKEIRTGDLLIAEGPAELADEIVSHIVALRLTPVESKNSQASTTSEPAVDGATNSTTAMSAENTSTGASETVGSTSQSA